MGSIPARYAKAIAAAFAMAAGIYLNHTSGNGDPAVDVAFVGGFLGVLGVPNEA